jgi:putative hydrolase of HD superfamily
MPDPRIAPRMHEGTLRFLLRAEALKDRPRRGWLRAGVARPESVADHAWGVAMLAALAAPEGIDRARAVELALLHDVCEAVTGDLVPGEYAGREEKLRLERDALLEMLEGAPEDVRARVLGAFDEMARDATPEARFVHELDKFEMALQAKRYQEKGALADALAPFRESARKGLTSPDLAGAARQLEEQAH